MVRIDRRSLLRRGAVLGAAVVLPPLSPRPVLAQMRFTSDPFGLGVASGEPLSDGFVLWTRLAPDPFDAGAMPAEVVAVEWQVAADPRFRREVRSGFATAHPERAHSVHVDVRGLEADREYWYRFRVGDAESPVGRARTLPVVGAPVQSLKIAFTSCQHYEQGYFGAYRHMLADDPSFVVHLGDYIYENSWGVPVRRFEGPEPETLDGYRARHALYKLDPDLRAMHAHACWLSTWDDHEVDNDYAAWDAEDFADADRFRARRVAAYQAYYEHMPLRRTALPQADGSLRLHQRFVVGDLIDLFLLDGRQYRSDQACDGNGVGGGQVVETCAELTDPNRTMLGAAQERWLLRGLERPQGRWTVIGQQTLFAPLDSRPGEGEAVWTDGWSGYPVSRDRILAQIRDRAVPNPVFIGGDMHSFWVSDLEAGHRSPQATVVASEFVTTSLAALGPPPERFVPILGENPHIRYFEGTTRGYALATVTPGEWRCDFRAIDDMRRPRPGVSTPASFRVESGRPGVQRV